MTVEKTLNNELSLAHCHVKLNGMAASERFVNDLLSVEVEQNLYLPTMFTIRLHNRLLHWFDSNEFKIGTNVKIEMSQDHNNMATVIDEAEITALELDAAPVGVPTVTLRGYSKLHRLQRERHVRSFTDVSDSDLVSKLAGEGGLSADAESTSPVFKYVLQNNETNFEFLQRRALRLGMELYVENSKLHLRKPKTDAGKVATVKWGQDLLHFISRQSAQGQIDKVTVRGWDADAKKEIVGEASSSTHHPTTGTSAKGDAVAKKAFGGSAKLYSVFHSVVDQTEAQNMAKAIYDDMAGRFIQIEAQSIGDGKIKAGTTVEIGGLGTKNNGTYYVTSCTHRFDRDGYKTWFEGNGRQSQTFAELLTPANNQTARNRVFGPVIGIVSNNKDADGKMNRVKVKLPVLGDNVESNWARIVTPMTGNGYGAQFMPEINDEVLVMFENGDIDYPYVIGGLWNGKDKPVKDSGDVVGSDGKVNQRIFKTRSGHTVTFDDSDDKPSISIVDKTEKNKIVLDAKDNTITIHSEKDINLDAPNGLIKMTAKGIEMTATENIKASATQNIQLKATQNVEIAATTDVKIEATANFKATANAAADIKGTAKASLAGATVEVKGDATATLQGSGLAEVKGGVVKIN